jgi:putative ABC transport system permease protein
MSIPLSKGRYFTEQDHDKAPAVVIVNESFANRFWPNEDPIGKHLTIPFVGGSREVVGVVSDVKHSSLDTESGLEMYVPYTQKPFNFMGLVVRTTGDPIRMAPAVRGEILSIDRSQPVYDVKSMSQIVGASVSQPRLYTLLLGIFATLAVVLAAVGIYGVMSYSVTQRSHEIGIRMALGADRSDILKMVVGNGMLLAAIGMAVGLGAAFIAARVLESLLFGVGIRDVTTFISVPLLLAAIAFLSCFIPARRATRIDPMVALRYE